MIRRPAFGAILAVLTSALACARTSPPPPPEPTQSAQAHDPARRLVEPHRAAAERIIARARATRGAHEKLRYLTDHIGHRLSGSEGLERAVEWAAAAMKADGLEDVRTEPVVVPRWERGSESGSIVLPAPHRLHLLALGGSAATPPGDLTAKVLVVRSFEELERKAEHVRGRVVLFDVPLPPYGPSGSGYGETVAFRSTGPERAARLGAVGALVRSVTATSLRSPHTGATRFEGVTPIPAAAVSVEDALLLARLSETATVTVRLQLGARTLPDATSANVIGEVRGRDKPEEVIVIGAHLDSWDVGQGAHDDGAGCVMVMEALRLLLELDLRPRRTIRAVLFTNEENGLRGALAYAKDHAGELSRHLAAIEADTGGFAPKGFRIDLAREGKGPKKAGDPASMLPGTHHAEAVAIGTLLSGIGAGAIVPGYSGADIGPLRAAGVPLLGLDMEGARYFDYHHSEADTFDKVDPAELALDVAAMAVMAYVIAELPERFGSNL